MHFGFLTDFTDFRGGVEQVIKRVIIRSGTPHRSLRSLCVVLTINQHLRGWAGVFSDYTAVIGISLSVMRHQLIGYAVICCDYKPRR